MKFLFLTVSVLFYICGFSQSEVTWTFSYNKKASELELTATIAPGWHLYSTNLADDSGPIATGFEFEPNAKVVLINEVVEPTPIEKYDPNFEMVVKYFENQVTFKQAVKVKKKTSIQGTVVYMVCNDATCLPPVEEKIVINLKK